MVSNNYLQLYKRADSKAKGRHLVATQDIRKNQLIHVERPILSLQSLGNSHEGALVCRRCQAFIGGPDVCLAVASGRLGREKVWDFYKGMENENYMHEGYQMICCRNSCGELFCSKDCEEDMWLSGGHELMCTGLIPDSESEKDEEAEDNPEKNENIQEENSTMHPLLRFKVHAVQSNEIFLMVGDLVATVVSLRRQHIENDTLAEKNGMILNRESQNLDDLMEPYLDFTLVPWWDVATKPMMTDPKNTAAVEHLDKTLKELCATSASLLKEAILILVVEASNQANGVNNDLFCSSLRQSIKECEEKFNVFSAEFFGKIIGSFEQNALGIRSRHPLCRDIIEDRSFRERGMDDIFKCLEAAGMNEDPLYGDISENQQFQVLQEKNDISKYFQAASIIEHPDDDKDAESGALLLCKTCDQGRDKVDRILATLDIHEEGNTNILNDKDEDDGDDDASVQHNEDFGNDNSNPNQENGNEFDDADECDGADNVYGDDLDALFTPLDGTAMYYTTCKMNHSCRPNVVVKYSSSCTGGGKFARWGSNFPLVVSCFALRDIREGEELCISYINEEMNLEDRSKALDNYGFTCNCVRCVMERNSCDSMEEGSDLMDSIFPEEDDIFPEDEPGEHDSNTRNGLEDTHRIKSLLEIEADLNMSFSESAHDYIPIKILAPSVSMLLNLGNKLEQDFCLDVACGDVASSLQIVSNLLKDRDYINALKRSLDAEVELISILQEHREWPNLAYRRAHQFFALVGALCHVVALNFLPAMKLIDKAIVFGLWRSQFNQLIEYVEYQLSTIAVWKSFHVARIIADFKQPCLKELVQKEGLSNSIEYPIETLTSICPYEVFNKSYLASNKPVVVRGFAETWPALDKWRDLNTIVQKHGHRIIPIELGNMSEKTGLQEQLISMRDFIDKFLIPSNSRSVTPIGFTQLESSRHFIAYCAQHQLFEQIPEMMNDIEASPSLCGKDGPTRINAWIGTGGTRTPCHFDSYDNLLVQVVGVKYVRLYDSKEAGKLYVIDQTTSNYVKQGNMSAVDCELENYTNHPLSQHAKYSEVVLYPGDCLYIPAKEWHYVRSLSTSASVNYWF